MPAVGTTHHLKLGTEYLIIKPNSYQKMPAPTFGARIATGDPDYNNLSIWQHWVQKCWIGGMDAPEWVDDAMYDDGVGVNTWDHERVTLARDLTKGGGSGWTPTGDVAQVVRKFIVYNGVLHCLSMSPTGTSTLIRYNQPADTWSAAGAGLGATLRVKSIAVFDGKLYIGGIDGSTPKVWWATGALSSWNLHSNPAGVTEAVTAMHQYNGKLYVAYGKQIWRAKDDQTWDGNVIFYKVGLNSDSNYVSTMEVHLGFLYMLSQNGHLHRTDGNNSFDIWSWDGGTYGVSLRSYDGKLFVATYEFLEATPAAGWGVLYQFTGAAVTELKRWGLRAEATTLGGMCVYDRKLFYGASNLFGMRAGFGIAVYDVKEDAHSIFASNSDTATYARGAAPYTAFMVDDVAHFAGILFCSVRNHGIFKTPLSYRDGRTVIVGGMVVSATRDVSAAGGSAIGMNGGWYTTSTYDAGTPGLMKLWRRVVFDAQITSAAQSIIIEYSSDDGISWTSGSARTYSDGKRKNYSMVMNVRSVSLKLRVTLRSTSPTTSPILFATIVSYLPQPEPNWMWTFTVPVADKWELIDETVETKDTNALILYLEGLFRSQTLVQFIDIDGRVWAPTDVGVLIYDITVVHFDIESPREADVRIRLLEVVENF